LKPTLDLPDLFTYFISQVT